LATAILRRVGAVLVVVGLIDIAVMIYCIVNRISYTSSFNIFAVIVGIFLLCGSLRAASIVRWLSAFFLGGVITALIALPFLQPLDLTRTQFRLNPLAFLAAVAIGAFVLCLLIWVTRELGSQPVQAALASAGIKRRSMRIPAVAGVGLVVVLSIFLVVLLQLGDTAEHAESIAQRELGAGYHFHVRSLNIVEKSGVKSVSGVVTAWNENEVIDVPVHWEEQ